MGREGKAHMAPRKLRQSGDELWAHWQQSVRDEGATSSGLANSRHGSQKDICHPRESESSIHWVSAGRI